MDKKIMTPLDVSALLKTEVIGIFPEEDAVFLSNGSNLPNRSESYKAYKLLAKNINEGTKKIIDVTNKYTGFLGSIKRGLKRSI